MSRRLRIQPANTALAGLLATLLAGCAGFSAPTTPPFRDLALSMPSARALVIPGQSTRSDVSTALGPATVVTFASGFEVWAYRTQSPGTAPARAELVILFDPDGVVRKTRLRSPS